MEGAVFLTVALGLLLIAVSSLSTTARGFLGFCLYLLIFAFAFVFLRSEAVKHFFESQKEIIILMTIVCAVILACALTYGLVSSAVKKKKADDKDIRENT